MSDKPSDELVVAWARLVRASQTLLSEMEGELKRAGLPPLVWYDVLLELARSGDEGLRPFELVERMLLAQYNTSRLLARLEADDLVERVSCPDDGRGHTVRITKAGRRMQRRIWAVYGRAIAKHMGGKLNRAQTRELADLLARLAAS
jgi:DNA-binding MarR family transcriptional regulator